MNAMTHGQMDYRKIASGSKLRKLGESDGLVLTFLANSPETRTNSVAFFPRWSPRRARSIFITRERVQSSRKFHEGKEENPERTALVS